MRLFLKILGVAVLLALLCLAGFALWGERLGALFSQKECIEWFSRMRPVAWLVAIGLLIADLALPIPATGVMAALGAIYGVAAGAAVAAAGSASAGLVGYGLARLAGKRGVRLIAGEREIERFRAFFDRWGGAGIIVSRTLPILPEVMSVLAGLARMSFWRFVAALLLGTVPVSIFFAYIGRASAGQPWYGVLVAVVLPLLLWPVFLRLIARRRPSRPCPDARSKGR